MSFEGDGSAGGDQDEQMGFLGYIIASRGVF